MNGRYAIRSPPLRVLARHVAAEAAGLAALAVAYLPRAENWRADALANAAMDAGGAALARGGPGGERGGGTSGPSTSAAAAAASSPAEASPLGVGAAAPSAPPSPDILTGAVTVAGAGILPAAPSLPSSLAACVAVPRGPPWDAFAAAAATALVAPRYAPPAEVVEAVERALREAAAAAACTATPLGVTVLPNVLAPLLQPLKRPSHRRHAVIALVGAPPHPRGAARPPAPAAARAPPPFAPPRAQPHVRPFTSLAGSTAGVVRPWIGAALTAFKFRSRGAGGPGPVCANFRVALIRHALSACLG